MQHIMKCPKCSKYTMEDTCSVCNVATIKPRPAKLPVNDKYAKYRRAAKEGKD